MVFKRRKPFPWFWKNSLCPVRRSLGRCHGAGPTRSDRYFRFFPSAAFRKCNWYLCDLVASADLARRSRCSLSVSRKIFPAANDRRLCCAPDRVVDDRDYLPKTIPVSVHGLVLVCWHVGPGNWNCAGGPASSCRSLYLFAAHRHHHRHSVAGCRTDG